MKTHFFTALTWLLTAVVPSLAGFAQESKSRLALNVGVINGYSFTSAHSTVKDYYSLGSRVNLIVNDTWLVGFAQRASLAPGNLLAGPVRNANALDWKRSSLQEYSLVVGRKWTMGDRLYLRSNVNGGISRFRLKDKAESDWENDFDFHSGYHTWFLAAEAGIGFQLNRYLALETGATYHRYLKSDKLILNSNEFNSLGIQLSLVGTIHLSR